LGDLIRMISFILNVPIVFNQKNFINVHIDYIQYLIVLMTNEQAKKIVLFLVVSLFCIATSSADIQGKNCGAFNVKFENDTFAGTDHYYTNGIKITWISPDLPDEPDKARLPRWLFNLTKYLSPVKRERFMSSMSVSIGHNIFTPEDISCAFIRID
jgi:hypothetical protein